MQHLILTTALATGLSAALATASTAEPQRFTLDPSHSQILFSFDHFGLSTTWNMFSGFEGEIQYDEANPENSAVEVSIPVLSMFTGWEARYEHIMGDAKFAAQEGDLITFVSTDITVTGEGKGQIVGDLTINDITQTVTLDATLNGTGAMPFGPLAGTPMVGFSASTTLLRSDYGLGAFAPAVSDELAVQISIEAILDVSAGG